MVDPDKVVNFLRMKGPCVPNDIKKALGGDTLIFGAMLSELISRGQVMISSLKKGSSPFYFLPGQEAQLENFVEFHNPKDQKTIALLKKEQVLRDKDLELFERVSLRQIKDFAKELLLNTQAGQQLFWRYYLLSQEDAIKILNDRYTPKKTEVAQDDIVEDQAQVEKKLEENVKEVKEENNANETSLLDSPKGATPVKSTSIVESKEEDNKDGRREASESKQVEEKKSEPEQVEVNKEEPKKEIKTEKKETESQKKLSVADSSIESSPFFDQVKSYFLENNIIVLTEAQISKDREYEFIIEVPSAVGSLAMYCRARNKKKLNEGDVAPALLKAKTKDLACLFLTNGDFTKKSLGMIEKEYKGVLLKYL